MTSKPPRRKEPKTPLDDHDWTTFVLAKDMCKGWYEGPEWVPYSLWQARDYSPSDKYAVPLIDSPGMRELWALIEQTYDDPNSVALQLPMRCAETAHEWALVSKRTPSEHREQMLRLKANALAIATEIEMAEARERFATGSVFDFLRLQSEADREAIDARIKLHNLQLRNTVALEVKGKALGWEPGDFYASVTQPDWDAYNEPKRDKTIINSLPRSLASIDAGSTWQLLLGDDDGLQGIVPGIPATMRSLADYFEAQADIPPLARPNFENAERNYWSRRLCSYFHTSYGLVSPTIVARIVSVFFPQGISENEVSKQISKLPPLPFE